jgi:hypothetical protein
MRIVLLLSPTIFVSILTAQSISFDSECKQFVQTQEWNQLQLLSEKQTTVEPNDPSAWFYLGLAHLAQKNKMGFEVSLKNLASLSDRLKVRLLYQPGADSLLSDGKAPRRISSKEWKARSAPYPDYPAVARTTGIQGGVLLDVWVGADGIPTKVNAIFGPQQLRQSAQDCLFKWKFEPMIQNEKPVPVCLYIILLYRLRQGSAYQGIPTDIIPK